MSQLINESIVSYFIFIGLIVASSYFSIFHLQKTRFLSEYNPFIYKNYIQLIYQNIDLKNGIIGLNEYQINDTIDSFINCDISLRFMEPNPFQIAISIWIIGFVWHEFKQIINLGFGVYLKAPSKSKKYEINFHMKINSFFFKGNYVDCSMNILYIFYFIFLYLCMIYTRLSMNTFLSSNYWTNIVRYETMSNNEKQYYIAKTHIKVRL